MRKELITHPFIDWDDAFRKFGGFKNVDKMKYYAKKQFLKSGAVMIYNDGVFSHIATRMDVPKSELEKP